VFSHNDFQQGYAESASELISRSGPVEMFNYVTIKTLSTRQFNSSKDELIIPSALYMLCKH